MLDLGPYDSQAVATTLPLAVTLDAYDVLSGAIALAAAGHEISLDLGATVPGVAGATLIIAVGAPAVRSGVARAGVTTTLSTQQIRIGIAVSVTVPLIATVRLPVVVDVAKAMATTQGPTCASGVAAMTIAVTPSVAEVWIGARDPDAGPTGPRRSRRSTDGNPAGPFHLGLCAHRIRHSAGDILFVYDRRRRGRND